MNSIRLFNTKKYKETNRIKIINLSKLEFRNKYLSNKKNND